MVNPASFYASPERLSERIIAKQSDFIFSDQTFAHLFDCVPIIIMVLNEHRQLVFGNSALADFLHLPDVSSMLGKRPGEILSCIHAHDNDAGCGTSMFCRYCGAVNAVLSSQKNGSSASECRITANVNNHEEAYDFRVWASPFKESFTFLAIMDIADEKRRLFLERIFLHDIANTCSSLVGFTNMVNAELANELETQKLVTRIKLLSNKIADQIKAHQQLVAAEYNQLKLEITRIDSRIFLQDICLAFNDDEILNGRFLEIDSHSQQVMFHTDATLLNRVVGNMIKNGLEGSVPGETVTCGCYRQEDKICIWVHNPTYLPENIRLQLFNRSFSTKGAGRGLGTYTMKYFTEKYLQGSISFTTDQYKGSVFTVCYPLELQ
ncbi:MAG: PAS domain-containing sensor histidine kinase [Desulfuromonas sp.]|nr:PAS domain-containing sensor histidine kinase [Desulfuromonas sp.]